MQICLLVLSALLTLSQSRCTDKTLARYRVTFKGDWSEEKFPNQYPKVRPHAQWSKLAGRSHDDNYEMWSLGAVASPAFKKFTQDLDTSALDRETSGFNGIFDTFYARPIKQGVGESFADFFADSTHSQVSLAVRLIPSPDWFVGIDTVDLCESGNWSHHVRVALEPLDAGVDRGYTFTSPNWASRPQQKIYRITAKFPSHRASSFLYPNLTALPSIASVEFQLLADYKLHQKHSEVTHELEADEELSGARDLELELRKEFLEEVQILHGEPVQTSKNTPTPVVEVDHRSNSQLPKDTNSEDEDDESLEGTTSTQPRQHQQQKSQRLVHMDCAVGEWGAWGHCSKKCGFGVQKRFRRVLVEPRGGRSCPSLEEEKWCGSMRACRAEKRFSWVKSSTPVKTVRDLTRLPHQ